ncbi:uncharacterized protein EI97DRAFT_446639 [Westerdykella ornata]|uniref:Uncharacterized protein n=1 Tax=Westerdykella ornata TaxID=318751 RepID=A0A6A6J6Z3_WESOR|nr:uncharacterized protein EI97DRAFT_446639 [Westerdykella ornata]KAF2271406.1 hypothetical protein EI97DRAFT_446639 [Westerdykella ornata]
MMDKLTSWAVFLALVGAGWWYYSQPNHRGGRQRGRSLLRANNTTTGGGDTKWAEAETASKSAAKQAKAKAPRKPVKKAVQSATEKAETYLSGASTTGAEADDDQSPVTSPTGGAKAPSGKDVSDMLAPGPAAPAVLKINPSEKPAKPSKPQQQRTETPHETKKQRQNRRKNEEAKLQREADEKKRQVLLENQRRTAREARGEPAKNGVLSSKTPATNAWASGRPASTVTAPLLDTFEPEANSTSASSEAGANGQDWANGLSEEAQLKMALEDSAWETVPKGKKQRKPKAAEDSTSEKGTVSPPVEAVPVKRAPAPKVENKVPQSRYDLLGAPDVAHPLDSDWGVV